MVWYAGYNGSVRRSLRHCHRFPSRGSVLKNTRRGSAHRVLKHARRCGVSRRGLGRQPIRQAATSTGSSLSQQRLAPRAPVASTSTLKCSSCITGQVLDVLAIVYSSPSQGLCLDSLLKSFHRVRLLTNTQSVPGTPNTGGSNTTPSQPRP
jgi:hypothetical protein